MSGKRDRMSEKESSSESFDNSDISSYEPSREPSSDESSSGVTTPNASPIASPAEMEIVLPFNPEDVQHNIDPDEAQEDIACQQSMGNSQAQQRRLSIPSRASTSGLTTPGRARKPLTIYDMYPDLSLAFEVKYNDGKKYNVCKFCQKGSLGSMSERLFRHAARRCKKFPSDLRTTFKDLLEDKLNTPVPNNDWNELLTKFFTKNNIPFRVLECKIFRALLEAKPPEKFPSREKLSSYHIPRLSRKSTTVFLKDLNNSADYNLSVEFDHWTDAIHRSILAAVVTKKDGTQHLIGTVDVSVESHTGESTMQHLVDMLAPYDPRKINAIVSDAAANCVSARQFLTMQEDFSHVIQHRCLAHFLNLIGKNVSEEKGVADIIEEANKLINFMTSEPAILAKFLEAERRRCVRYVKTRWFSTVNMLESLIANKQLAIDSVNEALNHPSKKSRKDARIEGLKTLKCDQLWPDMMKLVEVFRPLANCIAVAEAKNTKLGEATREILLFANSLFAANWHDPFILVTIKAFLLYFSAQRLTLDDFGLMLTSYFLDRRYTMDFVTHKGKELVMKTLFKIGRGMGYAKSQLNNLLVDELRTFCQQEGSFGRATRADESAYDWWSKQPDVGILRKLALRLATLRSSSANVERLFSTMKHIQGPQRLRFSLETMTCVARSRLANDWIEPEYDERGLFEEHDEEPISASQGPPASRLRTTIDTTTVEEAIDKNLDNESLNSLDTCDTQDLASQSIIVQSSPLTQKLKTSHLLKKLSDQQKKAHAEFFDLIDFTIVNHPELNYHDVSLDDDEAGAMQAVENFRRKLLG